MPLLLHGLWPMWRSVCARNSAPRSAVSTRASIQPHICRLGEMGIVNALTAGSRTRSISVLFRPLRQSSATEKFLDLAGSRQRGVYHLLRRAVFDLDGGGRPKALISGHGKQRTGASLADRPQPNSAAIEPMLACRGAQAGAKPQLNSSILAITVTKISTVGAWGLAAMILATA